MGYVNKQLLSAGSGNKLILDIGETIKARYMDFDSEYSDKYEKTYYHFKLKLKDGTVKELRTSAGKILKKFGVIEPGSVLELTKLGEGTKTDYEIDVVQKPKMAAPVKKEPVEEEVLEEDEEEEEEEDDDEVSEDDIPF